MSDAMAQNKQQKAEDVVVFFCIANMAPSSSSAVIIACNL
jgi:hypothetical protein